MRKLCVFIAFLLFFGFVFWSCSTTAGLNPSEQASRQVQKEGSCKIASSETDGETEKAADPVNPVNENIIKFSPYREYGFEFVSLPEFENVKMAEMVFNIKKTIEPVVSFKNSSKEEYLRSYYFENISDSKYRLTLIFPKSGDYEVIISGKKKTSEENIYYGMVGMNFSALVPADIEVALLNIEDRKLPFMVENWKEIEEQWRPVGGTTIKKYRRGHSAKNHHILFQGNKIDIEKGQDIRYYSSDSEIKVISFITRKSIPLTIRTNDLILKEESEVVLRLKQLVGSIEGETSIQTEEYSVVLPDNSRIELFEDSLTRADFDGTARLSLDGKEFLFSDYITVSIWGDDTRISFVAAEDLTIGIKNTTFNCPAKSYIVYDKKQIRQVGFNGPAVIHTAEENVEIEAGKVVWFAEDGSVEKTAGMKGGY